MYLPLSNYLDNTQKAYAQAVANGEYKNRTLDVESALKYQLLD